MNLTFHIYHNQTSKTNFFKGLLGYCFQISTHGVQVGRRQEKVCPDCISETVKCRKLILGRDIG